MSQSELTLEPKAIESLGSPSSPAWRGFSIEPLDVWLFRDGRPFDAGSDVQARSLRMPSPFAVFGALRTFFLLRSGISPKDFHERRLPPGSQAQRWGEPGPFPGDFQMRGPFWCKEGTLYFPAPADLVEDSEGKLHLLTLLPDQRLLAHTNLPSPYHLPWAKTPEPIKSLSGRYISQADFKRYLEGTLVGAPTKEVLRTDHDFFDTEVRTGIKLSDRHTAEEGFFYQVEYLRPKAGVSLYGEAHLPEGISPAEGMVFLGGERRMGYLRWEEGNLFDEKGLLQSEAKGRIKLILLSPAWFSGGAQPEGGWEKFMGTDWKLQGAVIPRLIRIGMFALKAGKPQSLSFYCVPPGAVFYLERKNPDASLPPFFTESPAPYGKEVPLGKLGFGLYATTSWDWTYG